MHEIETLFETRWLGVYRIGHWDFVRRPDSDQCVGILAVTDEREVLLVEQFRIPLQRRTIELPAGIVGDEEQHRGEELAETARRELLEETGFLAGRVDLLAITPTSSGMTSEYLNLFHATDLIRKSDGGGVAGEDILVHRVPLKDIDGWLRRRELAGLVIDIKIHAALRLAGY